MAMLAEKRTKTRYYLHHKTLNPRGNAWCEDSNKFGQRMLEKMGWSQGKGLGVNESGSTDPVHVNYKWDSKGMGYKGADGDEAVAQQKDFDALLATLSSETQGEKSESEATAPTEKSPKSLELLSQKSRARVHYHKFTRGKDLSRASSKDLACILGLPSESKPSPSVPAEPVVVPDVGPPIEQVTETTFGITTIARGNINEYFKHKYNERKKKFERSEENIDSREGKSSESCEKAEEQSFETETSEQESMKSSKKKKKKKNKRKDTDAERNDGAGVEDITHENENDGQSTKGRRKSVTWGDVEVSFVSKYIKDMVDTSSDSVGGDTSIEADIKQGTTEELVESHLLEKKKKKEKKKRKHESDSTGEDPQLLEINAQSVDGSNEVINNDSDIPQKKKKKKKKKSATEVFIEACNADNAIKLETVEGASLDSIKKKKKKKKHSSESTDIDIEIQEEAPPDRKKKKEKDTCDVGNGTVDSDLPVNEIPEGKKKKKKRKRGAEDETQAIEMPEAQSVSDLAPEMKKAKKERQDCKSDTKTEELICSTADQSSPPEPTLSALTQERMSKWKERRKTKAAPKEEKDSQGGNSVDQNKLSTIKLTFDPNRPTHDYNHKRVFSALGYSVKKAVDHKICVQMPPTNFHGSNLDEIAGYGQAIQSC